MVQIVSEFYYPDFLLAVRVGAGTEIIWATVPKGRNIAQKTPVKNRVIWGVWGTGSEQGENWLSQFIQLLIPAQISSPTSGCELGMEAARDSLSLHSFGLHSHSQKNPKTNKQTKSGYLAQRFPNTKTQEVQSTIWVGTPKAPTPRRKITRNPQKLKLLRTHRVSNYPTQNTTETRTLSSCLFQENRCPMAPRTTHTAHQKLRKGNRSRLQKQVKIPDKNTASAVFTPSPPFKCLEQQQQQQQQKEPDLEEAHKI